jgi:hypothetical protein
LFKDKIVLAIEDTGDSPLDSKLEAVLPGVHQRLVANQHEVLGLRTFVEEGFSKLGMQVSEAFECQEQARKEQDCQTGEAYMSLAQRLMGEDSLLVRTFTRRRYLAQDEVKEEDNGNDATTNRVMSRPHSIATIGSTMSGMGLNCTKIRQLRVVLHHWRQITKQNGELISPLLRSSIFLGYRRW